MKLYELPRNSYFVLEDYPEEVIFLHHIDGAYSVCSVEEGEIFHISASADVIRTDENGNDLDKHPYDL